MKIAHRPLICLLLLLFSFQTFAKKLDSYIITNSNDTIYGTIKISKFNMFRKSISIFSYNFEDMYYHIYFKPSTLRKYKELFPKDIQEFGFLFGRTYFRYISREIKPTLSKINKRKFYLQIAGGAINLFELRIQVDNQNQSIKSHEMFVVENFILNEKNELVKVASNRKGETISDFLMNHLKLDKEVLDNVVKDKTFKDIKEIVHLYNENFMTTSP